VEILLLTACSTTYVRLISSYNPESYGRKVAKRHLLFGHIVRYGIPAIWFTINPGDLRNPIVLRVAGVYICPQLSRGELNKLRRIHAIGNPTIVAQYFHFVLDSFFKKLLCTDSGEVGILGEISNHFGVVESNSRHMLHLHGFLWVTGNMDFLKLQERVLADDEFRNRLSTYMKATICEVVDEPAATQYRAANPDIDDFIDDPADPTEVFMDKMEDDSNYIASRCQIHNHTFTCFKYGQRKTAQGGEDGKPSFVTAQGCSPPFSLRKPTNS
jgi:helitron helicase-like protein